MRKTRAEVMGKMFADVIMESAHLTYNAPRGRKMVETCMKILQERIGELKEKKATPDYKKARYG